MFGLKKGPKGTPHGGTNGGSTHGGGNSGASHGGSGSGGSEGGVGIGGSQGGTSHDGVQGGSDPKPSPQPTLQPTKAADPKTDLPPKPTEAATTAKPADRSRYKPNFDAAGKILSYTLEGTNTVIGVVRSHSQRVLPITDVWLPDGIRANVWGRTGIVDYSDCILKCPYALWNCTYFD